MRRLPAVLLALLALTVLSPAAPALPAAPAYTFFHHLGPPGPATEDGPAARARFNTPRGVAVDDSGNVYVADTYNHTLRRLGNDGEVTTIAGLAGVAGSTDGAGARARFYLPSSLAIDGSDNLYVADTGNHTIRRVSPTGAVTTLAGSPLESGYADGRGRAARFASPTGIAVGAGGDLFVADRDNRAIRRVTPSGEVSTLTRDLAGPYGLVAGPDGDLYVTDGGWGGGASQSRVLQVSAAGEVHLVAGGESGYHDGYRSEAKFETPQGIAIDPVGRLLVADTGNHVLRQITLEGSVSTIAGRGYRGADDGFGWDARFQYPAGISMSPAGDLYLADSGNHVVRRVDPRFDVETLVATDLGGGTNGFVADLGWAIAAAPSGDIYLTNAAAVYRLDPGGTLTRFAGSATDWVGRDVPFGKIVGMAADPQGNLLLSDKQRHRICQVTPQGIATTVAGSTPGEVDGPGSDAHFSSPLHVALDGAGNLLVVEQFGIRAVTPPGDVITRFLYSNLYAVAAGLSGEIYASSWFPAAAIYRFDAGGTGKLLAGSQQEMGRVDGAGADARFEAPISMATEPSGDVLVLDVNNHDGGVIRRVTPDGVVTTVAGRPAVRGNEDGTGAEAAFLRARALTIDAAGNVLLLDESTIRKGVPAIEDAARIDATSGPPEERRQLDAWPRTATSYEWSVIRRPTGSTAALSSTSVPDPTFTPDVPDYYRFRLVARSAAGASVTTVDLQAGCAVEILSSPGDRSLCGGLPTTFGVRASGTPLRFQWRRNGQPISQAVHATLAIPVVTPQDAGEYVCDVISPCGFATSVPARLEVPDSFLTVPNRLRLVKEGLGQRPKLNWSPGVAGASSYEVYTDSRKDGRFAGLGATTKETWARLWGPSAWLSFFRVAAVTGCGTGPK